MNRPQAKPYPLRLDEDLNAWIKERAKRNDRSINAELVRILREKMQQEARQATDTAA